METQEHMKTVRELALACKNRSEAKHYSPLTQVIDLLAIADTAMALASHEATNSKQPDRTLITGIVRDYVSDASKVTNSAYAAAIKLSEALDVEREQQADIVYCRFCGKPRPDDTDCTCPESQNPGDC